MRFRRMPIEAEGAEVIGYDRIRHNLAESSVRDRSLRELNIDIDDLDLSYAGDHFGKTALRELIAAESGPGTDTHHIMTTTGASAGLFITALSLLEPGDHVVVARPNYASNLETPEAIGCRVSHLDLDFDQCFELDPDAIRWLVRPETRLVSLTCPNNPDGRMLSLARLEEVISIVEENGAWLLFDETYRELSHSEPLPVAATLSDRVISISSFSKTYGAPGIRVGWMHTCNEELMHLFLCAKEQICIHGSVLDETVAFHILRARALWLDEVLPEVREGKEIVSEWVQAEPHVHWVEPDGGATCVVRIEADLPIDYESFYHRLLGEHGTYPGPGHWFGFPKNHMRIGFAWNPMELLREGLASISSAIQEYS